MRSEYYRICCLCRRKLNADDQKNYVYNFLKKSEDKIYIILNGDEFLKVKYEGETSFIY